jgi:hypothetical protein
MPYLNLRYKPTALEEEVLEEILNDNPFFESREIFKFLLGFYASKASQKANFKQKRLQAIAKSFDVKPQKQADDDMIKADRKLKPLVF